MSVNSYLFCTGGADFFDNSELGNSSYANYEVLSALVDNISRVDEFADSSLGGSTFNSTSYGGKRLIANYMLADGYAAADYKIYSNTYDPKNPNTLLVLKELEGISTAEIAVFTACIGLVPVAALVAGIVVCVKRRYL